MSATCRHDEIDLIGNEETGFKSAVCQVCGCRLTRRPTVSPEGCSWYVYTCEHQKSDAVAKEDFIVQTDAAFAGDGVFYRAYVYGPARTPGVLDSTATASALETALDRLHAGDTKTALEFAAQAFARLAMFSLVGPRMVG